MDVSTPLTPLVTPPEAQFSALPTEIVERMFGSLMEKGEYEDPRVRSRNFTQFNGVSRLFRAVSKRNGHYYAGTAENLLALLELFEDQETVAGTRALSLHSMIGEGDDCPIIRRIILALGSAPKLKQLDFTLNEGEELDPVRQKGLLIEALGSLQSIEVIFVEYGRFPSETALCRALARWSKLKSLDIFESSGLNVDDDEAQPDLPSCLAQLSSTSFPLLNTLTIAVETTPRLQLVERILSFGRVTRLCLNVDLPNADDLDRLEVALREAAGRLKTFGTITPQFRPSFIRNLYPLLGVCDTLEIELQFGETIPLPTSLQILSLRNLTIFGATQEYLVELESFVLSRKTPLDVLEIDVDGLEYQRLEEACERVGTRLVKSCIEAVLSP